MVRARGVARKSFARRRVRRVKKYNSHVTPLRFKKYLPRMAELLEPKLVVEVGCETPTMELLDTLGVPTEEWPYYLGFMKRMIVLYRNFTSETLASEKESLITEYVLRGKDRTVLESVQEVAANCAEAIFEMDLWTRDFYMIFRLCPIACYATGSGELGSVEDFTLYTGPNINGWADVYLPAEPPTEGLDISLFSWSKNRKFRVCVVFNNNTNQRVLIVSGGYALPAEQCIGFKIIDNQIYGVVCDGVTETSTPVLKTIIINEEVLFEVQYTANSECKFLINNVEVGSLTTGFPTGTSQATKLIHAFIINTAAEDKSIGLGLWEFYQKR